ncbi:MAG: hypothetical protein HY556_08040 [Euryarchaeota archaeon]|nr:hypothetical protein [Euryarchaeota archaeon]
MDRDATLVVLVVSSLVIATVALPFVSDSLFPLSRDRDDFVGDDGQAPRASTPATGLARAGIPEQPAEVLRSLPGEPLGPLPMPQDFSGQLCPLALAAESLYASNQFNPPAESLTQLHGTACSLPLEIQRPIAKLVAATALATSLERSAWSALTTEDWNALAEYEKQRDGPDPRAPSKRAQSALAKVDMPSSRIAAAVMLEAIAETRSQFVSYSLAKSQTEGLSSITPNGDDDTEDDIIFSDPTGLIIVGGSGATTYEGPYNPKVEVPTVKYDHTAILIVDLGGNDTYSMAAGGSMGLPTQLGGDGIIVSAVLDIAGDDTYWGTDYCQGGASAAIGILHDEQGNDTYSGMSTCQGAGRLAGIGIAVDIGGDDNRSSGVESQGSGFFRGVGIFLDYSGDDGNWIVSQGQGYAWGGFGTTGDRAIGVFIDQSGSDTHNASICCARAYTTGDQAYARFSDRSGFDNYWTKAASNGFSHDVGGDAVFLDEGPEADFYDFDHNVPVGPWGNDIEWDQGESGRGVGRDGTAASGTGSPPVRV